ncbi:DUF2809 domain-containing protein [Sorangium sp. So ce296]|uniref:ribosomal maturation YjgA family protein n=1 Tax=unclassified Sorangium TaxID=2621164 RepID=UPI000778FCB4|nr:hypothetical protein BE20_31990 [Sorangium cellulosum]
MPEAARKRLALALLIVAVVPVGLAARFHGGPVWLRNSAGAVLYEVVWIAAAQLVWISARTHRLALAVFAATCAIELLQLSELPWLWAARSTTPGRLLLGANGGFDPADLALYAVGSALGLALCRPLRVAA